MKGWRGNETVHFGASSCDHTGVAVGIIADMAARSSKAAALGRHAVAC
jgi:hypothetical protein